MATQSTRHLIDPTLLAGLDFFPPGPTLSAEMMPAIRQASAEALAPHEAAIAAQFPDVEKIEKIIPGPAGAPDVRILVFTPKNASRPMPGVLYIHGGGYILGSADSEGAGAMAIASKVGATAVSVDYRLAPETPHPGPVEDCYAGLKWLYDNAAELGVNTSKLAVSGGSAGGGLAAALALLARDRKEVPLAYQHLIYPMLDDRTAVTTNPNPYTGEFVWTPEANYFGWKSLLGAEPGGADVSPYAAAARAESLEGLPPTYMSVGSLDLFLDEDLEYARRLIRAGVPVELHVYPGAYHGYNVAPEAWIAQDELRNSFAAMKRALQMGE